jgi:hypothetical protein
MPFLQRRYFSGTGIKAELEVYYYAKNPEQAKLIEQAFISPKIIKVGNKLVAERKDSQLFLWTVPFNGIAIYLDFYAPEGAKLQSDYRYCGGEYGIWKGGRFVCPEEVIEI